MTAQFPPASNHDDGYPWSRTGSPGTLAPAFDSGTFDSGKGVRPGESDPARMLSAVLIMVAATIIVALALVWWLI